MITPPNSNGWSYDNSVGNWKLIYSEKLIVMYQQTDEPIATGSTLFVGTQAECNTHILDCDLHYPDTEETE